VTIAGTQIPVGAAVIFAGASAKVLRQWAGAIEVETPVRAAGVVDVEVIGGQVEDWSVERDRAVLVAAFSHTTTPASGSTPAPGASQTAAAPAATPAPNGTPTPRAIGPGPAAG